MNNIYLDAIEYLDKIGNYGICNAILQVSLRKNEYTLGDFYFYKDLLAEYFKHNNRTYYAGYDIDIDGNSVFFTNPIGETLSKEEIYNRRVNILLLMHEIINTREK